MLIQDIIPPEKRKQISRLAEPRQVKKASKKALPVLLVAFLLIQIIAGPFVPFKFSLNPPSISSQEAKAVVGTSIATCLELQNMNNNLTASYYLTNDIDCSDTTSLTWNDGQGFRPVGYYDEGWYEFPFTGSFDGQGYKITNLFMNWVEADFVIVGGLFGYANDATIENVGLENVNITFQHTEWGAAGALVGDAENNSTISNSYSTGSVSGSYATGGLVGSNISNAAISNSYSTSSVNGGDEAGGLVGYNNSTISNSYSTSSVSGDTSVGGLVGSGSGTVSNSFWDTETSGQVTSSGGTGKTTAEMKNVRTFTDTVWSAGLTASWDFADDPYDDVGTDDTWNIDDTAERNSGYSFLSWQNTSPNIPTLISPANSSFTSDDTPTLSANYSDSDTGDTGTTNYRISSSSLSDCIDTDGINIVASGTSSATSDEDEDTEWIHSSSIGIDRTYYWCAQNNDGVAASAWTAMGTLILDTTGPTGSIANGSGDPTNDTTPTLNLSIADTGVGTTNAQMRFSCDDSSWSSWENYATPKTDFNIRTGAGCTDADGSKTIYAQFKDSLGNEGSSYNTGSFVLDTVSSLATFDSGAPANPTSQNTTDITVAGTDVTHYKYKLDDGSYSSETAVATHLELSDLTDGEHTIYLIGKDTAGNWQAEGSAITHTWTVDVTSPVISLSTPTNNSSTGDSTPTLTWSGSDATSGIAKYQLYIDSNLDTDDISSNATSTTPTNSLSCGARTWYIRAYDNADNYTDSSTFNLTMACGSGLPPSASNPPTLPESTTENPDGGFSVLINNDDEYTNNQTVTLKLNAGSDTVRMAISNTSDFENASQVLYEEEIEWDLLDCNTPRPLRVHPSQEGNIYTVYVKFYTQYGVASEVVSDSIVLKTITTETEEQREDSDQDETEDSESFEDSESDAGSNKNNVAEDNKLSSMTFAQTLQFGSNNTEVKTLQNKLKELNFFPKEIESNGNFGPTTKQAVIEYQKSKGIYPCGIVGPRTRKALNNKEFITNKDYQFTQYLKYNDQNEEVQELQTRLRDQNFFPHNIKSTGWFGSITQGAVNLFQKFYDIIQSGVVDEGTREVLNR